MNPGLEETSGLKPKPLHMFGIFKVVFKVIYILYCVDKTKIQFSDTIKDVANVTNLQSRNIALR